MFSSFNFEEAPKSEQPRRTNRKDRSVRYIRALSAKNAQRNAQLPSTSTPPTLEVPIPHQVPQPLPEDTVSANPIEPQVTFNLEPRSSTSDIRRASRWATVREKSPQMILEERKKKLDLNKGRLPTRPRRHNENSEKRFADVVKEFMVKSWGPSHNGPEPEPDRDVTVTNAVEMGNTVATGDEQRAILGHSEEHFQSHPTGLDIIKEFFQDKYRKVRYFYVNKNSSFFYWWSALIAIGILYNLCAMVIFIFDDVHQMWFRQWLHVNLLFDICFFLDILVGARMTFVFEGNEIRQTDRTFKNYRQSARFKWDVLALFPLDVILFLFPHISLLRIVRAAKLYRLYEFVTLTEKRTNFPHFMKILFLGTACGVLFHWNACVYFLFSLSEGLTEDDVNAFGFSYYKVFEARFPTCTALVDPDCWFPEDDNVLDLRDERPKYMQKMYAFWEKKHSTLEWGNFSREYSMTIYWSSLTITKCGQQPWPSSSPQNALEIFDTLIGVLVFATIIGSVGSVVSQMSQNVNDFREMMDGIKFYMKYREVKSAIQERVLSCFLYLNNNNQLFDEKEILSVLPPRFQYEMAHQLHSATLKGVHLFNHCDRRFLNEVVMLVKQQVYSPNDYLCRKNEKAKEMFIVKKGTLSVMDDDTGQELDQLAEGSTFGELSIIHVKGNMLGDRRSVSLRSLGYSDVYVLHQDDVTRLLNEYPDDRAILLKNARKMLHERGLMETSDMGEMADEGEAFEDEGVVEFLSVDDQLARLDSIVIHMDEELQQMVASFSHTSGFFKKKVTALENTYNSNKKRIRSDLYNGYLQTDYEYHEVANF